MNQQSAIENQQLSRPASRLYVTRNAGSLDLSAFAPTRYGGQTSPETLARFGR
jgi:hypothetical protein